ncbi:MAG: hypothetical protein HOL28_07545 [Crocinitomicaceae bacterium]|nr:hypothetical protein [Crocinitomicaceae bacterium]
MENHEIRYCKLNEADKLQKFIDTYWKKNHILAHSQELLDYQHKNTLENRYNFVVAHNVITDEFDIILGFIPRNQYDSSYKNKDIWLAIWKRNDKEIPRGLGKKMLDFLEEDYQPNSIGSIGINDAIEQLYLKRGWTSGILNLWYFIKPNKLISFEKSDVEENDYFLNPSPKSNAYYENRYDKHPFYNYKTIQGVVYRKIETDLGTCLRIVDFKQKYYLDGYCLNEILITEHADYIDCLNHGISDDQFHKMGFHKRADNVFITQWFEPLSQGVKNIKFAYKSKNEYTIMKGDSDQDRPNLIK